MGVPTPDVGYTPAMPRRENHEVHKRTCGGTGKKNIYIFISDLLKNADLGVWVHLLTLIVLMWRIG